MGLGVLAFHLLERPAELAQRIAGDADAGIGDGEDHAVAAPAAEHFLRALDHYRATESAEARQRLDAADRPVQEALREWMLWLVTGSAGGECGRGCFVVNTATELGTTDEPVHRRTEAAFEVTRQALRAALTLGRDRGDLSAQLDVDDAVELLFTTVLGLRVRERAGHDVERLTATIDLAIRTLGPDTPA